MNSIETPEKIQPFEDKLSLALCKMTGAAVTHLTYQTSQLQGGTLGDVNLVSGMAKNAEGEKFTYRLVYKTQKKWERYGDPGSWTREYDLYHANLDALFTDTFHRPVCYHSEISDNEIQLWMEYVEGVSGLAMTSEMYKLAAKEIGRFQGRLYAAGCNRDMDIKNLSPTSYMKNFYLHYRSWNEVYDFIRSADCTIPRHLCKMLISFDEQADEIFAQIEQLPVVFCHRDFWVANIFCNKDKISLIDWDTCGWGYLGEDIASLIADETDAENMVEYFHKCIPAYYEGYSEYTDAPPITKHLVREMIIALFGYRLVESYKFSNDQHAKIEQLVALQKIYEMGEPAVAEFQ